MPSTVYGNKPRQSKGIRSSVCKMGSTFNFTSYMEIVGIAEFCFAHPWQWRQWGHATCCKKKGWHTTAERTNHTTHLQEVWKNYQDLESWEASYEAISFGAFSALRSHMCGATDPWSTQHILKIAQENSCIETKTAIEMCQESKTCGLKWNIRHGRSCGITEANQARRLVKDFVFY